MNLLLTGATGFVGLNLLLRLLKREDVGRIGVCVRHGGKLHALLAAEGICGLPEKIHVIEGDASNWNLGSLPFVPDVCVHCAGVLFARDREAYFQGNVEGTRSLLAALTPDIRVIVLSSQAAVGPTPLHNPPLAEDCPASPLSFYGQSKLAMEQMLAAECSNQRDLLVLRPPTVLGPRDAATIPLFRMVLGPVWFKPGMQKKELSWIGVGDLVDAILSAVDFSGAFSSLQKSGSGVPVYFVSAEEPITDTCLIRTAAEVMQRRGLLLPLPKLALKFVALFSAAVPAIGRAVPSLMPDRARELWEDRWVVSGAQFSRDFSWKAGQSLREVLTEQARHLQDSGMLPR